MVCKNCGSEIPASAKFCDVCGTEVVREVGTRVKKKKKEIPWKFIVPLGILVVSFIFGSILISRSVQPSYLNEERFADSTIRVTKEQYEQINEKMTYSDVCKILGGDGEMVYKSTSYTEYAWPGKYYGELIGVEPKLRVSFNNDSGLVESIEEMNIIDGDEIYDNQKTNKEAVTKITADDLDKIPGEASYKSVCDIMGLEGVLVNSMHVNGHITKTYRWRYLSEADNEYKEFDLSFSDDRYIRY